MSNATYTKEQMKAGQDKASYQTRHFKDEASFREALASNLVSLQGLPHCPTQLLKGEDKAKRGGMVQRILTAMSDAGEVELVPGPTGKLNYVVAV